MLENALFESGGRNQTRKPATVLVSTAIHAVIVLVLVLVPLFQPQALPMLAAVVGIPLSEIPKPTLPEVPVPVRPVVQTVIQVDPADFIAPQTIPQDIARIVEEPAPRVFPSYVGAGSSIPLILRHAVTEAESIPAPTPPPPPAPAPAFTAPLRVGGNVQQANLVHQVRPDYPHLAKIAHVQGVVVLEATIGKDGSVSDVRVIGGHPLLIDAARSAVQQWRYKPTMLNNEPVEVITTVTVTFTLQ